jgi:hypothetical protein
MTNIGTHLLVGSDEAAIINNDASPFGPILLPLDVRPTATRTNSYIIDEVRHLPDHGILFGEPGDRLTDLHHDFDDRNVLEIADIRKQCVDVVA